MCVYYMYGYVFVIRFRRIGYGLYVNMVDLGMYCLFGVIVVLLVMIIVGILFFKLNL